MVANVPGLASYSGEGLRKFSCQNNLQNATAHRG